MMKARCPDCRDPICDSVGKFAILGRGESNDAQTVSGLSHSALKKAIYKHDLWECSPLFEFPNRVIYRVPRGGLRPHDLLAKWLKLHHCLSFDK